MDNASGFSRVRGRGRGILINSPGGLINFSGRPIDVNDPRARLIGPTPVAGHTRSCGFRNFLMLNARRRQVEGEGGEDADNLEGQSVHSNHEDEEAEYDEMAAAETRRLRKENEKLKQDVAYYYQRRVTLYLEQVSAEEGDVVKQGLSTATIEAIKRTMQTIKELQQRADENFQCLRHSPLGFPEEETEQQS